MKHYYPLSVVDNNVCDNLFQVIHSVLVSLVSFFSLFFTPLRKNFQRGEKIFSAVREKLLKGVRKSEVCV